MIGRPSLRASREGFENGLSHEATADEIFESRPAILFAEVMVHDPLRPAAWFSGCLNS